MATKNVAQYWILFAFIVAYTLYSLFDFIFPFLIGFIIAYCFRPVFVRIHQRIKNKSLASLLTTTLMIFIFIILFYIIIPDLTNNLYNAASNLPQYILKVLKEDQLPIFFNHIPQNYIADFKGYLSSYSATYIDIIVTFCLKIISFNVGILTLIWMVPFVMFFVLRDWPIINKSINKWIPQSQKHHYNELSSEINNALSSYLESQLLIALILSLYYSTALYMINFKSATTLGVFSGLLSFIPYAGCIVGFLMSLIISVSEFNLTHMHSIMIIFFIGYIVEIYILAPNIGKKLGLHPLWVFLSLFVGIQVGGPFGLMISIPTAITINIIIKYLLHKFQQSELYKDA